MSRPKGIAKSLLDNKLAKLLVIICLLAFFIFNIPPGYAATEVKKPTSYSDPGGATTTNPSNAYDTATVGDTTTNSTTTYGQAGIKITIFYGFGAATQTYTALSLKLLYSATAGSNDRYIVDYSTSGASNCSDYAARTWLNLVPASALAQTLATATATLPIGQNLTQLCVKYYSTKTGSPDGATFDIYDIWTDGTYTPNNAPNVPTLVSPNNGSITNDNTPTLSANFSDPDANNTGTTNYRIYRIATITANCLAGTVVASGTSSQTSSNNQNTTWTPGSSIGSDGTYYWCAQNNDGALTSSWTSMGNFILDTTNPTSTISTPADNSYSNSTTVALIGTSFDSNLSSATISVDGGGFVATSGTAANWTYSATGLSQGSHTFQSKATDTADNTGLSTLIHVIVDTTPPTLAFTDNVATGPVISDSIIGFWDDASIKKWDYDTDGVCSTAISDYTKTDANSMNQTSETNNAKYICLYAEDPAGNKSTLASANAINIDVSAPVITIAALTKLSNSTINDTTVHVTDNQAISAINITVDITTTAGYSNFNCTQTNTKTIDCTISIVSSGNLEIKTVDDATNQSVKAENNYLIDAIAPNVTITAPTKISNTSITDTTIHVTDNLEILSANVTVDASTTASTGNLSCIQTDLKTVDCAIQINSSGDLIIDALDNVGNSTKQSESGYSIVTIAPPIPSPPLAALPSANSIPAGISAITPDANVTPVTTAALPTTPTPAAAAQNPPLFDVTSEPAGTTQTQQNIILFVILSSITGILITLSGIFVVQRVRSRAIEKKIKEEMNAAQAQID